MSGLRHERAAQGRCVFGIARADITPPVGMYHRMWGASKHERSTGVHRPLYATVAAFGPIGGVAIEQLLVALDHCVMGALELGGLVEAISKGCGVGAEQISVVFSHTHGAGLMGLDRGGLPGGEMIAPYLAELGATCGRLAKQALEGAKPSWIVQGRGRCELARYRDQFDAIGGIPVVGYVPEAAADDTVLVARFSDERGRSLGTMVNYACHPTTLAWDNTLISPDFVGAMREVVEGSEEGICLFLQGASGELGPREGFVGDVDVADRNGRMLGYAALSVLAGMDDGGTEYVYEGPVVSGATIGVWKHRALRGDSLGEVSRWRRQRWHERLRYREGLETVSGVEAERDALMVEEARARAGGQSEEAADLRALAERKTRLLYRLMQMPAGEYYPLDVVLMEIGDLVWLIVQGESYSLLQRELRGRFPGRSIVVASVGGDWGASYLPSFEVYGSGIYQETIAVVEAGSLEQLIDAITDRLKS